jgi:meiotically up-regulated gene 157 (Mug157) protein
VDTAVEELAGQISNPVLACLLRNTLPNSLDTTVKYHNGSTDSFVVTGDIGAMWLRDSMNQMLPYMRFARQDASLAALLAGLVRRQTRQILADPFANAHMLSASDESPHSDDRTTSCVAPNETKRADAMGPGVFERKFELDSPLAFLKLSRFYYRATADASPLDDRWLRAVETTVAVLETMQLSSAEDAARPCGATYQFQRQTRQPTDSLLHATGHPAAYTGMLRSAFRPSDDACALPFHVPGNAMAVVELQETAHVLEELSKVGLYSGGVGAAPTATRADRTTTTTITNSSSSSSSSSSTAEAQVDRLLRLSERCRLLAGGVAEGIERFGVFHRPELGGEVYAYEVDGFGNALFMDDANIPSLLSLPYLGFCERDSPRYRRTRAYVLSERHNPWFSKGDAAEGVGGPHQGVRMIWPLAMAMRALTSHSDAEISDALAQLVASAAGTGLMHESFLADDVHHFTRPWFAWANSLFGELVLRLSVERPHLLLRQTLALSSDSSV